MQIIQFAVGFAIGLIIRKLTQDRIVRKIAGLVHDKREAAVRAQNAGGDADEYLRLEGEIRAYDNLFKWLQ